MIGIYTITNTIDGKIYVGYTTNFIERRNNHLLSLNGGYHQNEHLQRAYDKYGDVFIVEFLEDCSEDKLCALEHYWATTLNSHNRKFGYNIKPTHPYDKHKTVSVETKKKISIANKGMFVSDEKRMKLSKVHSGRKQSPETIEKRRQALKGYRHSSESRENMSKGCKGKPKSKESIEKRRLTMLAKPYVTSEETKRKISETLKKVKTKQNEERRIET